MDGWMIHLIFKNTKRLAEHKVIKPKTETKRSSYKQMQTKEHLTEHTRKDPKPNPKILQNIPPYFETTSTRGR
jgi:hypothetical protein